MKLSDATHGLKKTDLEDVSLTGETLDAYESFWDRSAQVDFIKAIADQDDGQTFESSGASVATSLLPRVARGARVLEVGCGAGRIMQHLAEYCSEVHGVDISAEMVARGEERLKHLPTVHFHHGNGYDLADFEDNAFDLVYSDICFQHMPKTVAFNYMREVYRVLVPGGWFRLQVPNLLKEEHWSAFNHFTQPYFVQHPYPMNFYTPSEAARMFVRAGFHIEEMTDELVIEARKDLEPGIARSVGAQIAAWARADLGRITGPAQVPVAEPSLPWTGERCLPWIEDVQVVYEHLLRYHFARAYCTGKRVIDLGSGEGYGAALLAETALSVVGIEIDAPAVAHASATYKAPGLKFAEGSVLQLVDIETGSIDVAVCFEVLEHVREQEQLLEGIKRILAPGGLVIISTPDRRLYTERDDYHNPFHVRELDTEEFETMLRQFFGDVVIWRQSAASSGSEMTREMGGEGVNGTEVIAVRKDGEVWALTDVNAPYLVAVAGDALPGKLPEHVQLVDPSLEIVRVRTDALRGREEELAAAQGNLADMREELASTRELASQWESRYGAVTSRRGYRLMRRLLALIGRG